MFFSEFGGRDFQIQAVPVLSQHHIARLNTCMRSKYNRVFHRKKTPTPLALDQLPASSAFPRNDT